MGQLRDTSHNHDGFIFSVLVHDILKQLVEIVVTRQKKMELMRIGFKAAQAWFEEQARAAGFNPSKTLNRRITADGSYVYWQKLEI